MAKAYSMLSSISNESEISPIYKSASQGVQHIPDFFNQVVKIHTDLTPLDLLRFLKGLEIILGRKVRQRWHSREIDLDVLLYDQAVLKDSYFELPHIELLNRQFVLRPLIDINPDLIHPRTRRLLTSHLDELIDIQGTKLKLWESE